MKNSITSGFFVTVTLLSFSLVSCSKSETDIIRENAEAHLEQTLDNPSSYEFVHLEYIEEITQGDNLSVRINLFNEFLEKAKETKKRQEESSFPMERFIERAEDDIKHYSPLVSKLESLKINLDEKIDETACHVYEFDFRASNPMGGIVLTRSYLYVKPDLEVYRVVTTGRMLTTCNELEEYFEIVNTNQR